MSHDFASLLQRDHHDLERAVDELLAPSTTLAQLRGTLDGVRLGLTAHAEAEDIVLYHAIAQCNAKGALQSLVDQARRAHLAQETALSALVCALPNTEAWRERASYLRELVRAHARHEEAHVLPAIRELAPAEVYASLAGAFATQRLRQLALLQPSAPIFLSDLAQQVG